MAANSCRRGWLTRSLAGVPYSGHATSKGWFERISRAQRHRIRQLGVTISGWPVWSRPLRIAFLSDLHTGSHADDVARLNAIVAEASLFRPDVVLLGGDYVNLQPLGGGRVPPRMIATALSEFKPALGCFAILGDHDHVYGKSEVAEALIARGLDVIDGEQRTIRYEGQTISLLGIPRPCPTAETRDRLHRLSQSTPTIVLTHDPAWFVDVPPGPILTLAGHTHGGQIALPKFGPVINCSKAPLRWSSGLTIEGNRRLFTTTGIGTSGIPFRWNAPPEFVILDVSG